MSYKISQGVSEQELAKWLLEARQKYGVFADGRVDYTNADVAPTVMCTVVYEGKILLVKRAYGLADAEGYWSTVNGFIDEIKPVRDQVIQEIKEELSLDIKPEMIKVGASYTLANPQEKRSYIIFPCKVTLNKKPTIKLDYENTEYVWIDREELENYEILDDLPHAIDSALGL